MSWKWCYENEDKTLATGWKELEGKWYFLNSNGTMATGWILDNDKWYFLDNTNGDMKTGWLLDKGQYYYLADNGAMYCNCSSEINGTTYYFDGKGVMSEKVLSDAGAEFIGSWEGLSTKAYYDPYYGPSVKKYWTIGYGTTYLANPSAFPNGLDSVCTKEQAVQWLGDEAKNCADTIKADLESKGVRLKQYEMDALISFAYNCGTGSLLSSTLYKNICAGIRDANTITANFQAWSNSNGQRSAGLFKRRTSEAALFLNGDYTGNN